MSPARGDSPFDSMSERYGVAEPGAKPGTTREAAMSISELNERTKALVESTVSRIWVRGEISDFKRHRSGHWYFSLRDASSQMQCVVWSSDQWRVPAPPDDGMQVVALAQMTLWQVKGTLQLRIVKMEASGDGLWRKAMQLTIAKLAAEGLMAEERKRPLPRYPRCIAIVTSTSGAAIRDIISVVQHRRPGMRIVISPAVVQGEEAPDAICAAISRVVHWRHADLVIVGRGGGSREDLWAFNDERVARAVATCAVPVISAVGHEIDITVCDLVADMRAATPSAAAERAVPSTDDMRDVLARQGRRLREAVIRRRESAIGDLRGVARDMRNASVRAAEQRRSLVSGVAGRLHALSPLATLERGYAVARSASGETLSSVAQFSEGEDFSLIVRDGTVHARTTRLPSTIAENSVITDDTDVR